MKWTEINIGIGKHDSEAMVEALLELVDPLVTKFKEVMKETYSWHYLWEGKPWPLTLRLRFYGNDEAIDRIKQEFEKLWNDLKASRPDILVDYCYGRHGECGKEYVGEEEADNLWYDDRRTRLKIVQKINKLFKHVCIKIEYVGSEEEARKYEKLLTNTYKPLNPHYKKRKMFEKLLRFIEHREEPCTMN